jgi:hydroxymethylpyrimidine/phosphomethylpyrimidine kinase
MRPRVLVIAGLDPSGRAGLLADGEAIAASGALPLLCASAIAAQSSARLVLAEPISGRALRAQIEGVLEDGPVAAAKTGMIGSREVLEALVEAFAGPLARVPLVVDPVLSTSRGGELFEGEADDLWPLLERAVLVTPNLAEASALSGLELGDEALMHEAASRILLRGARSVLIKGGHLAGAPADLLLDASEVRWFRGERIRAKKRGTGCRLASAVAAHLARGEPLARAVELGIEYVRKYLARPRVSSPQ